MRLHIRLTVVLLSILTIPLASAFAGDGMIRPIELSMMQSSGDAITAGTPRELIAALLDGLHRGDTLAVIGTEAGRAEFLAAVAPLIHSDGTGDELSAEDRERIWSQTSDQLLFARHMALGLFQGVRPRVFTVNFDGAARASGSTLFHERVQVTARLDGPDASEAHFEVSIARIDGNYRIIALGPITTR